MLQLQATVLGSLTAHLQEVTQAARGLRDLGVNVLSPSNGAGVIIAPDVLVVAASGELRQLPIPRDWAAVDASDFVWLVSPGGRVGAAVAMYLGLAVARGVPVLGTVRLTDPVLAGYVTAVPDMRAAVRVAVARAAVLRRGG